MDRGQRAGTGLENVKARFLTTLTVGAWEQSPKLYLIQVPLWISLRYSCKPFARPLSFPSRVCRTCFLGPELITFSWLWDLSPRAQPVFSRNPGSLHWVTCSMEPHAIKRVRGYMCAYQGRLHTLYFSMKQLLSNTCFTLILNLILFLKHFHLYLSSVVIRPSGSLWYLSERFSKFTQTH